MAFKVWRIGAPLREFMFSEDMAESGVFLMENTSVSDIIKLSQTWNSPDSYPPQFLNIVSGREISIKELTERIRKLTEFEVEIMFDSSKSDGTKRKAYGCYFAKKTCVSAQV